MNLRFLSSFLAALALSVAALADASPRVHPGVYRTLRKQGTVNLIVTLASTTEATVKSVHEAAFATRTAKIDALKTMLDEQVKTAAAPIEALLRQEQDGLHAGFQTFWISNQVFVKAASLALVEKLVGMTSVGSTEEEGVVHLAIPRNSALAETMAMPARIGAPDVWADGNIGQGVLVGTIDGGVRWTHESLKRNFVGAYGWYDPEIKSAEPYDTDGHGTHTTGTLAGSKGIGVVPGVKWVTCKGCRIDAYESVLQ
ncbi:hypothetical protein FI667_g11093, partial [Globisporangium splendens]